eukprot:1159338-Pelagomonas_calceolata.AAC.17
MLHLETHALQPADAADSLVTRHSQHAVGAEQAELLGYISRASSTSEMVHVSMLRDSSLQNTPPQKRPKQASWEDMKGLGSSLSAEC